MYTITRKEFLDDLCPSVRTMVAAIIECEGDCAAFNLLYSRPRVWMEAADLAYHLQVSTEEIVVSLGRLESLLVLSRREIMGVAFFHLTENQEILQALDQYWTWRQVWRSRWQETRDALHL